MESKFFKPDLKKIVVFFLIIITPYFLSLVSGFSPRLFLLEWLGTTWEIVLIFPFFGSAYLSRSIIIPIFILLAEILLLYLLSCLIVDKVTAKKAVIICVLFIILMTVIPNIGTSFLVTEKTIPQTSKIEDVYVPSLNAEFPYLKFQELTVQNNFFLPTMYKLSEDTVCRFDNNLNNNHMVQRGSKL